MSTRSKRSALLHVLAAFPAVWMAVEASAEAPELLRVQGVVTQLQGGPVADGGCTFLVEIFDVATGGSPLFSTTVTAPVAAGAYSLPIAPAAPGELTSALEGAGPRFVQVTVVEDAAGNPIDETLLPRQQLASTPYAQEARYAQEAQYALAAGTPSDVLSAAGVVTTGTAEKGIEGLTGLSIPGADGSRRYMVAFTYELTNTSGSGFGFATRIRMGPDGTTADSPVHETQTDVGATLPNQTISLAAIVVTPQAGDKITVSVSSGVSWQADHAKLSVISVP